MVTIHTCRDIQLTHLCFADDLLIFADGRKSSVEGIMQVFKNFAMMFELHISMDKSTLYLEGTTEAARDEILA